jgi:hypothetical protein
MKIRVIHSVSRWSEEPHVEIEVDGSEVVSIGSFCECPEDATLYRDLGFVYDIPKLMKEAYEAGKRGEEFEIEETNEEDEEE